jgi:hypothetical protein
MGDGPRMLFEYVDHIFVGVHTSEDPRDEEWERHCQNIEREGKTLRGLLVYTEGGGPTARHRKRLQRTFENLVIPPTAILTDSAMVRGIITSINWFADNQLAAFAPKDLSGALRYIARDGPALDTDKIVAMLARLAERLSVKVPIP